MPNITLQAPEIPHTPVPQFPPPGPPAPEIDPAGPSGPEIDPGDWPGPEIDPGGMPDDMPPFNPDAGEFSLSANGSA